MKYIRASVMILAIAMLLSTSLACAEDRNSFLDTAVSVFEWQEHFNVKLDNMGHQDARMVMDTIDDALTISEWVLMDAANVENDQINAVGEMQCSAPEMDAVNCYCTSGTRLIKEMGVYCEVEASWADEYLSVLLTMHQKDGSLVGMQKVELSRRGEEIMALLVDYDHLNWMTGRFAMLPDETSGRVIFNKTLGQTMDVVLDVKAWSEGKTLESWDKDLLLPAGILYK